MKPLVLQNGQLSQSGAGVPYSQTGQATVPGVTSTPGWVVLGAVWFDSIPASVILEAILLVSQGALTGRVHLYDTVAAAVVTGSTVTTTSTTDSRQVSGNIAGALTAGRIYQFRAECTGGNTQPDFAVVRYAMVR